MVYLDYFEIPKDSWVDYYFNVPEDNEEARIKIIIRENIPDHIGHVTKKTDCDTWYPWNVLYGRGRRHFAFSDITIFYGGNGSGKSTLLNVIAQKLKLSRKSRYNKSNSFDDYVDICESGELDQKAIGAIQRGQIVTSEDIFDTILQKRKDNEVREEGRDALINEFQTIKDKGNSLPKKNLLDPEVFRRFKEIYDIQINKNNSCSKYIRSKLDAVKKEQSNGETAFNYFVDSIKADSLVLLDEPENSMSARWQIELSHYLLGTVLENNCQLIISTHSPFLLSLPGAKIYDLDNTPIKTNRWYNLENIRYYYQLFKDNEIYFE